MPRASTSGKGRTTRRGRPARRAAHPDDLALRSVPVQARGRATFDRILDAAARKLEEVGLERLTTNMIAAAARANIATLYKYFPNKHAVLVALFRRQTDARNRGIASAVAGLSGAPDWEEVIGRTLQYARRTRQAQPGSSVLRRAMRSSPDLLTFEEERIRELADVLAAELVAAGALPRARARTVARVAVEASTAVFDLWDVSGRSDAALVREAKTLVCAYLGTYLGGPPARRRGPRGRPGGAP